MNRSQITEILHRWVPDQGAYAASAVPASGGAGFIKGPLPLPWVQQAAALPGKTLHVGLCLWYLAGLTKSKTVRLASKVALGMGVSRDAKSDALRRLAAAGLIRLDQKPGQAPLITLLDR